MSEITPNTPNPVREDAYVEELAEKLGIEPQYIPKSPVWRNEEEIRAIAEMFANMQGGGSSGGGVLVVTNNDGTLDKTWQEIHDASLAVVKDGPNTDFVFYVDVEVLVSGDKEYIVRTAGGYSATTDSPSGYPVYTE